MATTLDTLVARTRRFMRDYPAPASALTVSLSTSATSLTVTDTSVLPANYVIEVDYEAILVTASVSSTVTNVTRGWAGTTAVSHANSSTVLIRPAFLGVEIIDALNEAKDLTYPLIYKEVSDVSLTTTGTVCEYTLPNMPGTYGGATIPIQRVDSVEILYSGSARYLPLGAAKRGGDWIVKRSATPKLQLNYFEATGSTLRVHGYGPFPDLAAGDSLDAQWPVNMADPLAQMAASLLLSSGEAGRSRVDVGARDDREAANKPGAAIAAAQALEESFRRALAQAALALPPLETMHEMGRPPAPQPAEGRAS